MNNNFLDALNDWGSVLTDTYEDNSGICELTFHFDKPEILKIKDYELNRETGWVNIPIKDKITFTFNSDALETVDFEGYSIFLLVAHISSSTFNYFVDDKNEKGYSGKAKTTFNIMFTFPKLRNQIKSSLELSLNIYKDTFYFTNDTLGEFYPKGNTMVTYYNTINKTLYNGLLKLANRFIDEQKQFYKHDINDFKEAIKQYIE